MTNDELDKEEIRLKSIYDNLLQNAGPSESSLRILNEIWNIQKLRELKRKIVENSRDMSEDKLLDFGPDTCSCGKCERCVGKVELLEFQSLYGHLYEKIKSLEKERDEYLNALQTVSLWFQIMAAITEDNDVKTLWLGRKLYIERCLEKWRKR